MCDCIKNLNAELKPQGQCVDGACVKKDNDYWAAEAAAYDDDRDDYDDYDDYDDDFDDELAEAEMNCSMRPDGKCGQAGSEYCDWVCPIRREHEKESIDTPSTSPHNCQSEGN
jgi:hypothetical protein